MRNGFIAALLLALLMLSGAGRGTAARKPELPVAAGNHEAAAAMAHAGIDRLKTDGVAGLCELAFLPGKSVNNLADRQMATEHIQRLRDGITTRHGKSSGEFEFIRKEMIGASLVRFIYLEKLERSAVVWKLVFYRTAGVWKWKDLGVTDHLETEFRAE
jgi:hypothetical protein